MIKVIDDVDILVYINTLMIIPKPLQSNIIDWYHCYLMHPSKTRLEETVKVSMYWAQMIANIESNVKTCKKYQCMAPFVQLMRDPDGNHSPCSVLDGIWKNKKDLKRYKQ